MIKFSADPFSDEEMSRFLTVTQEKTGMELLSSTEKSNLNINKRGEHFGTTSSCITKVQAYSEEANHSLHSTIDVLKQVYMIGITSRYQMMMLVDLHLIEINHPQKELI